ncbi:MAG: HAD-IA family hydrolase, partial [Nitrospirota bacterium]|nr:HAD-IA family hydrolase [Nitrospirota bacterium]
LEPFGHEKYSVEETKAMVGSGMSALLGSLVPSSPPFEKDGAVDAKELAISRFIAYYSKHLVDNTTAYPFVRETLPKLGACKKAVLSNKREEFSRQILDSLGLLEYFELVWGSDSVREKKPSPRPVLDLMDKFGVSKEETAVIGDSNYDVEAGRAAGVKVVGVTYGFRSREFLKEADVIIDRFDELPAVIPKL